MMHSIAAAMASESHLVSSGSSSSFIAGAGAGLASSPLQPLLPRNEGVIFFWLSSPSQSAAAAQQNQKKQPRKWRPWHMTSGRSVGPHGPGAPRGRTRAAAKELLGRLAFGPALVPRSLSLSLFLSEKRLFFSLFFLFLSKNTNRLITFQLGARCWFVQARKYHHYFNSIEAQKNLFCVAFLTN